MATPWDIRPNEPIVSSSITIVGGDVNAWQAIDDDPDSPDLANYIYDSGSTNGELIIGVTDTPADFASMDSPMTVRAITQATGFSDDSDTLTVQITDSSGTALTNSVTLSNQADTTQALRTASLTLNSTGLAADKTTWDGARLRLLWTYTSSMAKDNGSIRVYALEVESTYTESVALPTRTGTITNTLPSMQQSATYVPPERIVYRSFPTSIQSAGQWTDTSLVLGYITGASNRAMREVTPTSGGSVATTATDPLEVAFTFSSFVRPVGLRAVFNIACGRNVGTVGYSLQVSVDGAQSWENLYTRAPSGGHSYQIYSFEISDLIPAGMVPGDLLLRVVPNLNSGIGTSSFAHVQWWWSYVQVADAGVSPQYPDPANYPLGREAEGSEVIVYGHSWMGSEGYQTVGNHFTDQLASHFGGTDDVRNVAGSTSIELANNIKGESNPWVSDFGGGIAELHKDEGIALISSALNDNIYLADSRHRKVKDGIKTAISAARASHRVTHDWTLTPFNIIGQQAFWTYTGTWNNDTASAPSGMNGFHLSSDLNATAEFTFDKSSEVCVIVTGWNEASTGLGAVDVYFDDVFQYNIDTQDDFRAATEQTGPHLSSSIPIIFRDLSYGEHKVRIEHAGPSGSQISVEGAYITTPADLGQHPVIVLYEGYPSDLVYSAYNEPDLQPSRATFDSYETHIKDAIEEMGGEARNIWLVDIRPEVDYQIHPEYYGDDQLHLNDAGMDAIAEILIAGGSTPIESSLPSLEQAASGSTSAPSAGQVGYSMGYSAGYASAAASQHTGAADSTLPSLTQSTDGGFVAPTDTGTISGVLPSLSQSATAIHTAPEDVGVANSVLPTLGQSAQGDVTPPSDIGIMDSTLPALTQAADAIVITPEDVATINSVLPPIDQAASGTTGVPADVGGITSTLPAIDQVLSGTTSVPADIGTIGSTLPSLQQAAVGTSTQPTDVGDVGTVLPSLTQTAEGAFSKPGDTGTISSTLPALSQNSSASSVPPEGVAVAASILPALQQQAQASSEVPVYEGSISSALPSLIQSASAGSVRSNSISVSGSGQVNSVVQKQSTDEISVSGAGTISIVSSAEEFVSTSVSVSGSGLVSQQAVKYTSAATSVTGAGSLTIKTIEISPRLVIVKGAGTASVVASRSTSGSATTSGTGTVGISYVATESASGISTVNGAGALSTDTLKRALNTNAVGGGGTVGITSTASELADGTSIVSGNGDANITHTKSTTGVSTVSGSGLVKVTHISTEMGAASTFVTGRGTITVSGSKGTAGSSAVSATETVQVFSEKIANDSVSVSVTGAVDPSAYKWSYEDLSISTTGTVDVVSASTESTSSDVAVSGAGSVVTQTYKLASNNISTSGTGLVDITSTASESVSVSAAVSGAGQVDAQHTRSTSGASVVSGSGLVNVQPISTEAGSGTTFVTGRGVVNVASTKSTSISSTASGTGSVGIVSSKQIVASASVSGTGSVFIANLLTEDASGAAVVSGSGRVQPVTAAQEVASGSVSVTGSGNVPIVGNKIGVISTQTVTDGSVNTTSMKMAELDNTISATDTSDIEFTSHKSTAIQLSGIGTISVISSSSTTGSYVISGGGDLSVGVLKDASSVLQIGSQGDLNITAQPMHVGESNVTGSGWVEVGLPILGTGTPQVSARGTVDINAYTSRYVISVVSGSGSISLGRKRVGTLLSTIWVGRDKRVTISNRGQTIQPSIIIE